MSGERIQTEKQTAELLAWYRLSATDSHDVFLYCRHGEHRKAPCSKCYDESLEEVTDMPPEDPPVPVPEPDEPDPD